MKATDLVPGTYYKTSESRTVMLFHETSRMRSPYGRKEQLRAKMETSTRRVVNIALSQIQQQATDEQIAAFQAHRELVEARQAELKRVYELDADTFAADHARLGIIVDNRREAARLAQAALAIAEEAFEPYSSRYGHEQRQAAEEARRATT
jgi:hypothetical protein